MSRRVLICANPDLNYLDGSSIWAQTIALVLAQCADTRVDFIAKSPPKRDELFDPLVSHPAIHIVNGVKESEASSPLSRRLTGMEMASLAGALDARHDYDVILVRGLAIAEQLVAYPDVLARAWIYLTDMPDALENGSPRVHSTLREIAIGCERILCQTDGFTRLWHSLIPDLPAEKLALYPPVISDIDESLTPVAERPKRAVYAGKFKSEWMTLEMAKSWPSVQESVPRAELVMIGDKFHSDADRPDFQQLMKRALKGTPGLVWEGAMTRNAVEKRLKGARVGLSWRSSCMDESLEYSTKVLEYGGCGCAAILNRNALHEQLLGPDYPLFANTAEEYKSALHTALTDDRVAEKAVRALKKVAERHTFSDRIDRVSTWLQTLPSGEPRQPRKLSVVAAGHDLKFLRPLMRRLESDGRIRFTIDAWTGHDAHDVQESVQCLDSADLILCEWCLGNVKWYAKNKKPGQRLVVRFHAQELKTKYFQKTDWSRVDQIVFVAPHIQRAFKDMYPEFPDSKMLVIPNFVDDDLFKAGRRSPNATRTLGMIGYVPRLKRMDRALDLLGKLLERNEDYVLRIKGRSPMEYAWMRSRSDERTYYEKVFHRINHDPLLRCRVIFDPPGDDVADWLQLVGHILSPSDSESFHMALAEGMLAGCNPVIWERNGAKEFWPDQFICADTEDAVQAVLHADYGAHFAHDFVQRNYCAKVAESWLQLLQGMASLDAS